MLPIQVLPQLVTSYTVPVVPYTRFATVGYIRDSPSCPYTSFATVGYIIYSLGSALHTFCHSSLHQSVPVRPPHVSVKVGYIIVSPSSNQVSVKVGYIIVSPSSNQRLLAEPSFRAEREHRQFKIDTAWRAACLTLGSRLTITREAEANQSTTNNYWLPCEKPEEWSPCLAYSYAKA